MDTRNPPTNPANRDLSRRAVLRGAGGVTLGLPLLDVFAPRWARAADAAAGPRPSVFVCTTCGVAQPVAGPGSGSDNGAENIDLFWPTKTGALTLEILTADRKTRALGELADAAGKLIVVRGVNLPFGIFIGDSHNAANASMLTGHKIMGAGGINVLAQGESIDNRIAREKNPAGREPLALQAGLLQPGGTGNGKPGYCSYRAAAMPRAAENDPWNAYQRVVGMANVVDANVIKRIATRRLSVNDLLRGQIQSLLARKDLSGADRQRLDTHFAAIREIEFKVVGELPADKTAALKAVNGKALSNEGKTVDAIVRLHMDVAAFALASGYTSTATLKIGDLQDRTQYVVDGMTLPIYHWVSHRMNSDGGGGGTIANAFALQGKVDRLFMNQFKYLLDRLQQYTTPEGNLLDIGFAAWTNHMGNGALHTRFNVPWIIAGSARGTLKPGQFIDVGSAPNTRIFSTLLYAAGVRKPDGAPVDDQGDASMPKAIIPQMVAT